VDLLGLRAEGKGGCRGAGGFRQVHAWKRPLQRCLQCTCVRVWCSKGGQVSGSCWDELLGCKGHGKALIQACKSQRLEQMYTDPNPVHTGQAAQPAQRHALASSLPVVAWSLKSHASAGAP
jgi:hypothetical protein